MSNSELQRVSSRIEGAIRNFCQSRLQSNNTLFFMADLARHVSNYPGMTVAPSSPDRILRALRAKGAVNYTCVNRTKSLYKVLAVAG